VPEHQVPSIWGDETPVVDRAIEWVRGRVMRPSDPKTTARAAADLAADTGRTITPDGIGGARALQVFDEVLAPATRAQDDPLNLAYIPSAPTRAAVAFDLVTSAANVFGGHWEAGAGAIFAENEALQWLVDLLGWPSSAGGCFVSGGTSGNLAALVVARDRARSQRPAPADGRWKLACTSESHSSVRAVAHVMDVDVVSVPVDADDRLTGAALREVLAGTEGVFAVVASAGSTNAGIVDDLAGVTSVAQEYGVWVHIDGAYGGAALAAPSARSVFRGIEQADSFIVDPHKWLFAPYDCCALLYRDPVAAQATHAQNAEYLDTVDRRQSNPSDFAVHLSRRARGLPFWFSLATHGTRKYSEAVELSLANARRVASAITAEPGLRLVRDPELSVVLFERDGWTEADYESWSRLLSAEGLMLCLPTRWHGRSVLRLAFVNPRTDVERVIELLRRMDDDLSRSRSGSSAAAHGRSAAHPIPRDPTG